MAFTPHRHQDEERTLERLNYKVAYAEENGLFARRQRLLLAIANLKQEAELYPVTADIERGSRFGLVAEDDE